MDHKNTLAVEFENVYFSYIEGIPVLQNVNFEIHQGEYVCIIGHNGSGKSTISKVLGGLLKPQAGKIKLFHEEINSLNLKKLRNNIGIIFQNPDNQFVGLTVEDDLAFGLENRKVPRSEMQKIVKMAADALEISDLMTKEPAQLSGGQKQRVAIAGILAINPEIILFDESTSMLDPKGKKELKELIYDLRHKLNKTIISITHDMEEVVYADRVIVMEKGQVVATGSPDEIFVNESNLRKLKLDYPFTLKLATLLNEAGVSLNKTLKYQELIEEICQK
ncbi:energy-coupling factor transporter ATPase [Ureaplasma sp. OM1]|uniref:Energy-coupling factor transporter ATPase n=1 Tax=Ureaplasma ceti TaxID=3119530 RepID=A0ABP9U8N7_9BACT